MAVPKKIKPAHWQLIVNTISWGQCVPFLGAGVNASHGDYKGLPLGTEVAHAFLEELTKKQRQDLVVTEPVYDPSLEPFSPLTRPALDDLARVALHLKEENAKSYVVKRLAQILDKKRQPSEIVKLVASLPVPLIVTTNYDRLLERAVDKRYKLVVQSPGESVDEKTLAQREQELAEWKAKQKSEPEKHGPIIYKLHGSFAPEDAEAADQPRSVVVTEEDYIEFLSVLGEGIPAQIRSVMKTATFLFLGYSLEDLDFRTLYQTFRRELQKTPDEETRSIAIQKDPSEFWTDYWDKRGITIYDIELCEFAEELAGKLAEESKKRP